MPHNNNVTTIYIYILLECFFLFSVCGLYKLYAVKTTAGAVSLEIIDCSRYAAMSNAGNLLRISSFLKSAHFYAKNFFAVRQFFFHLCLFVVFIFLTSAIGYIRHNNPLTHQWIYPRIIDYTELHAADAKIKIATWGSIICCSVNLNERTITMMDSLH